MILRLFILSILTITSAYAGGKGSGGVSDLLFPAMNFVLLFGFIIMKSRKPLAEMFTSKATEVQDLYQFAEKKSQEAEARLEKFSSKMNKVETETNQILEDAKTDGDKFAVEQEQETKETIARIERDTANKIESEKKTLLRELNASLLEEVIAKTKENIKKDNAVSSKATEKLVSQIR